MFLIIYLKMEVSQFKRGRNKRRPPVKIDQPKLPEVLQHLTAAINNFGASNPSDPEVFNQYAHPLTIGEGRSNRRRHMHGGGFLDDVRNAVRKEQPGLTDDEANHYMARRTGNNAWITGEPKKSFFGTIGDAMTSGKNWGIAKDIFEAAGAPIFRGEIPNPVDVYNASKKSYDTLMNDSTNGTYKGRGTAFVGRRDPIGEVLGRDPRTWSPTKVGIDKEEVLGRDPRTWSPYPIKGAGGSIIWDPEDDLHKKKFGIWGRGSATGRNRKVYIFA